ncbi:MAG TPA: molybdopterin oxidoreductase family protein [Candidatus Methylomirabilis sp.]|nr:molybdopterin oxidoreductase family protein [Candidatus Methylomirabilis sp.]
MGYEKPASATGAIRYSVCPHDCPSTCALEVEVLEDGHIGRLHGAKANTYTAGVICEKVGRYAERLHHPDRLTRPLLRAGAKGSGEFRVIGWDEALDRIAERFLDAAARHGSEAVWPYYYAGTMGLVMRDGINRLRHVMRYSRQKKTICTASAEAGWIAGVGRFVGSDAREMARADLIVVWGGNPVATQASAMTHIARARRGRGAKLVVVDPYRSDTAARADLHLCLRPGTDAALACAVMHCAFRDGHVDRSYLRTFTDNPTDLEAHLAARGPEWAAAITGLTAEAIESFARLYNTTKRSYIRVGYGFTRSRNGSAAMHAVTCLPAVTGAWAHEGGGAFWSNRSIYHWDKTMIEGLDVLDPATRELDMCRIGAALGGDSGALRGGPPVTAMLIQNTNPAVVAPDSNRVRRGLLREDLFLAVHEQFMTDTARYADVVLPATMFLEHDDLYQAGGHSHIQIGPKIVEPPGECRSNHEVLQGLARRLGATHPGFEMTPLELIDWTLHASGWPDARTLTGSRWVDAAPLFRMAHFQDGFGTSDKKFHFAPDWSKVGADWERMPRLPDQLDVIEAATPDKPFRLMTSPARGFLNTSFTETPGSRKRERRPTALIHPKDSDRLGLADDDPVSIGNERGTVTVHVRRFDGLQPGTVVVEGIWPNRDFEGGVGVNALVGDDPIPPFGGGAFHDTAVWLRPATRPAKSS